MGDFLYYGDHSITIDPDGLNINTWKTWHMAPKSRPFVVAPSVKESYVDVPGADGSLDYTDILAGVPRFANRVGQWEFIIDNGPDYSIWHTLYSEILMKIHGKRFDKIILDDDPDYYWTGRLTVTGQFGNKDYSSITIGYNLYPYKMPIGSTSNIWWKWNELFSNTILYGTFSVNGRKFRNIINENSSDITAVFTTTYYMDMYPYDGTEEAQYKLCYEKLDGHEKQHLITGSNDVTLHSGNNYFLFVGNGNVTVEYERGKTL
jgi:hypothetical protein